MQSEQSAATNAGDATPGPDWPRRLGLAGCVLAPLVALSVAVYVFVVTGPPHCPLDGDGALCELAVREVGRGGPLVGCYSRLGFHHPGPLHYFLLAPVYRLFESGGGFALSLGTGLLHAVLLAVAVLVAGIPPKGGRLRVGCAFAVSFASVAYVWLHTGECFAAWEPGISRVAILTTAAAAFATATTRRLTPLLVATFAASLAVQSHLSVVPPIGIASLVAVVGLVWRGNVRTACGHPVRRAFAWALALAVVLWIPPLVEEWSGSPGNLTRTFEVLGQQEDSLGAGAAIEYAALASTDWAERAFGWTSAPLRGGLWGLQWVAAIVILVLGVRRRSRDTVVLGALAVGLHAAVLVATWRIVGDYSAHLVLFGSTAVWPLVAASAAWCVRWPNPWSRVACGVALAAIAGRAAWNTGGAALEAVSRPSAHAALGLSVEGERFVAGFPRDAAGRSVVVSCELPDGGDSLRLVAGVVLKLRKLGWDAHADEEWAWAFPFASRPEGRPVSVRIVPVAGTAGVLPLTAEAGMVVDGG